MRWLVFLLALVAAPLRADEPHLEFVERLRANALADVALDYLDSLAKNPPQDIAGRLPLERAKTLVALAEQLNDDLQRDERLTQARLAFEAHLKTGLDARTATDVRLELARMTVRQGRYRVAAARRQENKSERQDALAKARLLFDVAVQDLQAARSALETELAKPDDADRTFFAKRLNETQFEVGILTMNRALTYSDRNTEQLNKRGQELNDARKQFMVIAERDGNDPLSWRAFVEAGRCCMELDNSAQAFKVFSAITKAGGRAPPDVARTARYYELLLTDRNSRAGSVDVIRGCEEWLDKYSQAARTPEGQGVQYLLASNLIQQAQGGVTPGKADQPMVVSTSARLTLEKAERYLKRLAAIEGDFARKAANMRSEVLVTLMAERAAAGIGRLANFEECFLSAQVDTYQMSKAEGTDAAAKRQRHLRRAVQALQRGLLLTTQGDDPKDVFTARVMLSYLFLISGDPYSAAVLGEHLAHSNAPAPRGAKAAAYGLSAYATILTESRSRHASLEEIGSDVRRLRSLAEFVEHTWPNEPDTDAARFQLGNLFFDDRQYADAFDMLARVGDKFPAFAYARYRQGAAAQLVQGKTIDLPADVKKRMLTRAIADLDKISDPTPGSSTETVLAMYQARLQLGQLLLLDGETAANFDRVEKIGSQLKAKLKDLVETNDPAYQQLEAECERTRIAGLWGKALLAIQAGQYDQAQCVLEPQLRVIVESSEAWKKSPSVTEHWFQGFLQSQRDVLLLDARANILAGKPDSLRQDLENLKKLTDADKQQATYDLLLKLVFDLKKDLDGFKKANDTACQQHLQGGLVGLLDELAKPTDLTSDVRMFLAQGYSVIDRHDKAAQLLATIPAPKADEESALRTYRFARLTLAREHRLGKDFASAKSVLREMLGTQQQKNWGFDNFDVRRESIALLEDEGQFAGAVQMAVQMQSKLLDSVREYDAKLTKARQLRQQPDGGPVAAEQANALEQEVQRLAPLRERYYEFYYCELRAIVKNAQKNNDAKSQDVYNRMAVRLVKLERGQPDLGGEASRARFAELIAEHSPLKEAYLTAGGKALVTKP
jgi:tetratricopeptide (TPR) repeat protein